MRDCCVLAVAVGTILMVCATSHAGVVTTSIHLEEIVTQAFGIGSGSIADGSTATVDLFGFNDTTPDGVADFRVSYDKFISGGVSVGASVSATGTVSWSSSTSGGTVGDYAIQRLRVEFLTPLVNAQDMTDFSQSSANGTSLEYEFGFTEIVTRGAAPLINSATLATYNANNYTTANGDARIHDLFGGAMDGVAFYSNATANPDGSFTTGTGIGNADQHYATDAVGSNIWSFFSSTTTQDVTIGSIDLWYGIYDVNAGNSSAPGGSLDGSETTFSFTTVPEPAGIALVALAWLSLLRPRRRRRKAAVA